MSSPVQCALLLVSALLVPACADQSGDEAKDGASAKETGGAADGADGADGGGPVFVSLPGGTFEMGTASTSVPGADASSAPVHMVTLSAFELSETEVTNASYVDFLNVALADGLIVVEDVTEMWPDGSTVTHPWVFGSSDSPWPDAALIQLSDAGGVSSAGDVEHADNRSWITHDASSGFALVDAEKADWPVTWVKWHGAQAYAETQGWSLPTEAQWEYAAKCTASGAHDAEFATASGTAADDEANWNGDTPNQANHEGHVVAVRSYAPNGCGLYELSGNAWEWVQDWYGGAPFYTATDGATDPVNTEGSDPETAMGAAVWEEGVSSTVRVRRGGSWNYHTATITSWGRAFDFPQRGNNHFGFRVAR